MHPSEMSDRHLLASIEYHKLLGTPERALNYQALLKEKDMRMRELAFIANQLMGQEKSRIQQHASRNARYRRASHIGFATRS